MRLTPRSVVTTICAILLVTLWWTTSSAKTVHASPFKTDTTGTKERRLAIEEAFQHAWNGYSKNCMGADTFHPVSNTCGNDFGGWGATAIDTLSTAIMMRNHHAVTDILHYIADELDMTKVQGGTKIQIFEVTIRHFAAMISAWDLFDGPFKGFLEQHMDDATVKRLLDALYSKMVQLGQILACVFNTPSGVPRYWVDPVHCTTDDGQDNTIAGAGSLILEFNRFSDITQDPQYINLARKAQKYLVQPTPQSSEPFPGLIGHNIRINDGEIMNAAGSWGSLSDSFYEYLLKMYVYDRDEYRPYMDRWLAAADSTIQHIASHPYGHPDWVLLPEWNDKTPRLTMDALTWFAGGNFILGGMVTQNETLIDFGLAIANTAGALYSRNPTKLGGEYVEWTETCGDGLHWRSETCDASNSVTTSMTTYILRPEVIETWYYAYRATKDQRYRDWAWNAFQSLQKLSRTDTGYAGLADVTAEDGGSQLDKQESFFFAEVLKYLWLIHHEDDTLSFHVQDSRTKTKNKWVLNTEAHPFRVVGIPV